MAKHGMISHSKYINIREKQLKARAQNYCSSFECSRDFGKPVTIIKCASSFSYVLQYPCTGQDEIDQRIIQIVDSIRTAFDNTYFQSQNASNYREHSADITLLLSYETYIFAVSHLSVIFFETHEQNGGASAVSKIHAYHFDLRQKEEQPSERLIYRGFRESASLYAQHFYQTAYEKNLFENHKETLSANSGLFDCFALTWKGVLFFINPNTILPDSYSLLRLIVPYENMQPSNSTPARAKISLPQTVIPQKPMVALTFDDGPNPIYTNSILDILEEYGVTATFFDVGTQMEQFPSVSQRELLLHCEVGSHSYRHDDFLKLHDSEIKKDIDRTSAVFRKVLGQEPRLFRPPYGHCDSRIKQLVRMPCIHWSLDTRDWESRNAKAIMEKIKNAGNLDGKVILMHSIYEASARATSMLIPYLTNEGYQLVTVSQLINSKLKKAEFLTFKELCSIFYLV